ncbi:MAG: hypothetical protein ABIR54_22335 [Burkholderiaceae bacterium]
MATKKNTFIANSIGLVSPDHLEMLLNQPGATTTSVAYAIGIAPQQLAALLAQPAPPVTYLVGDQIVSNNGGSPVGVPFQPWPAQAKQWPFYY